MGQPFTLTTLAALAVAGTGVGLYLGKSSVALIDPIHYSKPYEGRFFADLVPNPPSQDAPPAIEDASLVTGLGTGCIGCQPTRAEYYAWIDSLPVDLGEPYAVYDSEPASEILVDVEREITAAAAKQGARATVERYAHFPVTAEEEAPATLASAASAPEAVPAQDCAPEAACAGGGTPGI